MRARTILPLLITAALLLPGAGAQGARGGEKCVETTHASGCKVEPKRITIGASSEVRSLEWLTWGGERAVAVGILRRVGEADQPGRIKLYAPLTCGKTWYSKATVRYGPNNENTHIRGYPFTVCDN